MGASYARQNLFQTACHGSYTMQSILVAVLGGISPVGGKGNVPGIVMVGVLVANYHINERELRKQRKQ